MKRRIVLIAAVLLVLVVLVGRVFVFPPQAGRSPISVAVATASPDPVALAGQGTGPTVTGTSVALVENATLRAAPGATTALLTWPAVAGASGYVVYRDGAADPLTAATYRDIGLSNGRNCSYIVTAVDQRGQPRQRLGPAAVVLQPFGLAAILSSAIDPCLTHLIQSVVQASPVDDISLVVHMNSDRR